MGNTGGYKYSSNVNGLAVDTLGFPFFTHCTQASVSDDQGLIEMLSANIDYFKRKPVNIPKITILIEGHIPMADVKRLLTEKSDVVGIAVPGMPIGSPGMESGDVKEPYTVFTFDQAGQTTAFAEHNS